MLSKNIYIQEYSLKSFVVRGETRDYKESLKVMGGKWNSRLTDKETGDKFGAWLFWSDKRSDVKNWISNGCKDIRNNISSSNDERKEFTNTYESSSNTTRSESDILVSIKRIESNINGIYKMLEALCEIQNIDIGDNLEETNVLNNKKSISTKTSDLYDCDFEIDIEDEDEDDSKPLKRLIRSTKE